MMVCKGISLGSDMELIKNRPIKTTVGLST